MAQFGGISKQGKRTTKHVYLFTFTHEYYNKISLKTIHFSHFAVIRVNHVAIRSDRGGKCREMAVTVSAVGESSVREELELYT